VRHQYDALSEALQTVGFWGPGSSVLAALASGAFWGPAERRNRNQVLHNVASSGVGGTSMAAPVLQTVAFRAVLARGIAARVARCRISE
jgi:hypothetical protein